ncbi:MAG: acyl-CoA thioesterase [Muribaculaceae bacterium]|nr:acyl-CoA thioesterase [Muribaculaceae bacterium]
MDHNNLPSPEDFRHRADVQLRFNDVDVLGHVNNTVYFSFYDTGKALYFGATKGMSMDWRHVDRVIANVECAYLAPIVFGEDIEVLTRCVAIGRKSFTLQQMLREKKTGQIKSVSETVMVSINPADGHAVEVSRGVREAFSAYEGRDLSTEH